MNEHGIDEEILKFLMWTLSVKCDCFCIDDEGYVLHVRKAMEKLNKRLEYLLYEDGYDEYAIERLEGILRNIGLKYFPYSVSDASRISERIEFLKKRIKVREETLKYYDNIGDKSHKSFLEVLSIDDLSKKYDALRVWLRTHASSCFLLDWAEANKQLEQIGDELRALEEKKIRNQPERPKYVLPEPDFKKARMRLTEFQRGIRGAMDTELERFLIGDKNRKTGDYLSFPLIYEYVEGRQRFVGIDSSILINGQEFKIMNEVGDPFPGFWDVLKDAFVLQQREGLNQLSEEEAWALNKLRQIVHSQFLLYLRSEKARLPKLVEEVIDLIEKNGYL